MLEEAKQYLDKRVYVYGLITGRFITAINVSVQVEKIERLPMDGEVRTSPRTSA
jgi:hypothetical protein